MLQSPVRPRTLISKLLITLTVILPLQFAIPTTPATAQNNDSCQIDLVEIIAALTQAQSQVDNGNPFKAIITIEATQAELDLILQSCEGIGVPLPETFTSPDELFRFGYPEGWDILSPEQDIYFIANSQNALNIGADDPEKLGPGSQMIAFLISPMDGISPEITDFDSVVEAFKEEGLNNETTLAGPISSAPVNNYEARAFTVTGQKIDGFIHLLKLNDNTILLAVALTPAGEAEELEPVYRSVLKSIRYGSSTSLLPPGKALNEITYANAVLIDDLVEDIDPTSAVLAPDGSAVAWFGRENGNAICVYTFIDSDTTCTPLPDVIRNVSVLIWSPDSSYIAFTEEFFRSLFDPDIWLFDLNSNRVINYTNDSVEKWLLNPPEDDPIWLDHTITWGPEGNLYFIRNEIVNVSNDDDETTGLYRLDPGSGNIELIQDISHYIERLSVYNTVEFPLNGAMSVSPNGQYLALLVRERESESPNNGLWIIDLLDDAEPKQWVTSAEMRQGLPDFVLEQGQPIMPFGLAWSDDSEQLFLFAGPALSRTIVLRVVSAIDLETGDLTPLIELTHLESQDDVFNIDETTGYREAYQIPRTAVMSPDRTAPLIFHIENAGERAGLTILTHGQEPTLLHEFEDYEPTRALISSVATDGKLLIYGYLFIPEE